MATSIDRRTFDLRRGDDFEVAVDCFDSVTGDPLNMTGWSVEATLQFSNCPPVEMTHAWVVQASGRSKVSLTDEQTAGLTHVGEYTLQARAISPSGKKSSTLPSKVAVRD
jgi:hypothetical protein